MPVTDQIADLLTRIRNAARVGHERVLVPASKVNLELVKLLRAEGYLQKYELVDNAPQGTIRVTLRYGPGKKSVITGLRRVSRPGLRVYVPKDKIPRILGGLGVAILSTSRGILSDREARRLGVGGEVICQVW